MYSGDILKTIYLNEKKKMTQRRVRKIIKKLEKLNKKEKIVVAINKDLSRNQELLEEIKKSKIEVLTRQMGFKIYAKRNLGRSCKTHEKRANDYKSCNTYR